MMTSCSICDSDLTLLGEAKVRGTHVARYLRCSGCGFVRVADPYWLKGAYSDAIASSDVGLVRRNFELSSVTKLIITLWFDRQGTFLDYGGGYGLFVRLMRDEGFDFRWIDPYCENIFAKGFEASPSDGGRYEMLTVFELFEHVTDPVGCLEELLAFSKNILFSTLLLPSPTPLPSDWWYYGLDHGQHVSFYTRTSLELLARRHSLRYVTNGKSIHLFTDRVYPTMLFFPLLARYKAAKIFSLLIPSRTLQDVDYKTAVGLSMRSPTERS